MGYLGMLLVLLLCGLALPLPEDVPLLTGGWLCYEGLANFLDAAGGSGLMPSQGENPGSHSAGDRFAFYHKL